MCKENGIIHFVFFTNLIILWLPKINGPNDEKEPRFDLNVAIRFDGWYD